MPDIFKALATITAWILFVWGCLMLLLGSIIGPASGGEFFGAEPPHFQTYAAMGVAIGSLVLAAVVMRLRQKME